MKLIWIKFLQLLFVVLCFLSCSEKKNTSELSSQNFELTRLSDGVYACIHKFGGKAICNVGIIDTGKETLIFDTFLSPEVAEELLTVVEELGLSPIKYVVNSHCHNDHIRGNQVFPSVVKIISTKITADLIEEWEPLDIKEEKEWAPKRFQYYDSLFHNFQGDRNSRDFKVIQMWRPYYEVLSNSHKEVVTRLPSVFVEEELIIEGPDRHIKLITKGAGHTKSDLIMYLPNDKIVFTGDLVFNDCHPYIAHGDPEGWKNWLSFMENLDAELIIPGHGEIGTAKEFAEMRNYIIAVENLAINMISNNIPIENIGSIEMPEAYRDYWFDRFFMSNLRFMHGELLKNE